MITPNEARKLARKDMQEGREVAEQVLVNIEEEYGKTSMVADAYRSVIETEEQK